MNEKNGTNHAEHMKDMKMPMEASEQPNKPSLWESRGVYLQLNPKRKARLREIARSRGIEESPLKALAAYLDEAQDGARGSLKATEFDTAGDIDDLRSLLCGRIDRLEQSIGQIHHLVMVKENASSNPGMQPALAAPTKEDILSYETPSLLAWLDSPMAEGGLEVYSLALLQACWIATRADRSALGKIALELCVEALHVDGCAVDDGAEMRVVLENMDPQCALAAGIAQAPFDPITLVCKKSAQGGWHIATFRRNNATGLGEQLAWYGQ
ncbi:hypothetical protein [Janthinobacterium lividum]|uniref:hypothetical protein n=1 Tax=Janthinobacterium lividum TaxID=29581 RepID=UPI0011134782|nr:hypothetical protein [Janthinobacterium lividum]